jgi:hypothetical protein
MPSKFRINTLIILILAVLFYFFFMTSKHDPILSPVNPFAEDPFDAIGSFGIQVAGFLGFLSFIRVFWFYRKGAVSEEQKVTLARTQMLVVLAVAVTLAGDRVAMARYPSLWTTSAGGAELAALLGGLFLMTLAAGVLVYRSVREIKPHLSSNLWIRALIVLAVAGVILAIYPDSLRQGTPGVLFTVIVGTVLLIVPMWALGTSLIPIPTGATQPGTVMPSRWLGLYKFHLIFVILLGILVGFFLVLGESTDGGGAPHLAGMAFVAAVYIGLEISGLLIGYIFLRKPLGLFQRNS